jgi:hypothetical protein
MSQSQAIRREVTLAALLFAGLSIIGWCEVFTGVLVRGCKKMTFFGHPGKPARQWLHDVHAGVRRGDSDGTMTRNGRILEDYQRFPGFDFDASPQRVSDFFWRHLS